MAQQTPKEIGEHIADVGALIGSVEGKAVAETAAKAIRAERKGAVRLTKLEKEMLHRAAEFALAGEWPWEENGPSDEETPRERRERVALENASRKIVGAK